MDQLWGGGTPCWVVNLKSGIRAHGRVTWPKPTSKVHLCLMRAPSVICCPCIWTTLLLSLPFTLPLPNTEQSRIMGVSEFQSEGVTLPTHYCFFSLPGGRNSYLTVEQGELILYLARTEVRIRGE